MSWVRSGYCCRCGDCCRGDPFHGEQGPPVVEDYCPLYRVTGCSGYGTHPYYLSGCNIWPNHPIQIENYSRCTYKFEWVNDG